MFVASSLALAGLAALTALAASEARAQSAAVEQARAARTTENPALVWTPSAVVLTAQELAPGVFAVVADDAEAKASAGIPVATSGGFAVGEKGVLLVETMINRNLADQTLALVREATDKPILYAVNTSYHGDHSYGNQFLPEETLIVQHAATQAYIASSFDGDVAFMSQYFGSDQGLDELAPQPADILLDDGGLVTLDLGGIEAEIRHLGFAQTEGDLFIHVPSAGVLFTGNPILAEGPTLPWLLDGRRGEAVATLRRVRETYADSTTVVPGHGAPTGMAVIDAYIAYLDELERQVAAALEEGLDEAATVERVGAAMQAEYGDYAIYPWVHSQINVPQTYRELSAKP